MASARAPSLLTFSPMVDSETCRFILTRYQTAYEECPHIFGWVSILALWYGGTVRIPILFNGHYRLVGPHALVDHFEPQQTAQTKLIPAEKNLSDQVEKDWATYNGTLGAATAVLAYYHLLPHRGIMIEPFTRGVPGWEKCFVKRAYPFLAGQFRFLLRLNPQHAAEAHAQIKSVFEATDKRLVDGRRYLVGDSLTLSDIALAASAAPLLLPDFYGSPIPPLEQMPPAMASIISELRDTVTGRFVARIYRDHRRS